MATKLSNSHINTIIEHSKSYNIFDTYIVLAHISREVKHKFLIQTYTNNISDLVNQVRKYLSLSYKTVYNNVSELMDLNILKYDDALSSWYLVDMEAMVKSKSKSNFKENDLQVDAQGYTNIRDFFFTPEFHSMKGNEKRLIVFISQLCDSKASKSYTEFNMNLFKSNSKWMNVLKTKCKYYAKATISKMLETYGHIFEDFSAEVREKDLAPKKITDFKFSFRCFVINKINGNNDKLQYDLLNTHHSKELELVKSRMDFANVSLSESKQMHIVRAISTLKEWYLKDRVVTLIINKYRAIQVHNSREDINSLPAYLTALVKAVINEFNEFRETINHNQRVDIGEEYIDSSKSIKEPLNFNNTLQSLMSMI